VHQVTHREIELFAVNAQVHMYDVVREAWEAYRDLLGVAERCKTTVRAIIQEVETFTKLSTNPEYYFAELGLQSDAYRQLHVKLARAIRVGGPDAREAIEADLDKYSDAATRPGQRDPKAEAVGADELVGAVDELERDQTAIERDLRQMAGGKPSAQGSRGNVGAPGRKRKPPKAG
jgi:hypothetical protein